MQHRLVLEHMHAQRKCTNEQQWIDTWIEHRYPRGLDVWFSVQPSVHVRESHRMSWKIRWSLDGHQDSNHHRRRLVLVPTTVDDQLKLDRVYTLRCRSVWREKHILSRIRLGEIVREERKTSSNNEWCLRTSCSLSGRFMNMDLPPVSIRAPWIRYCIRDRCMLSLNLAAKSCALSSMDRLVVWPRS